MRPMATFVLAAFSAGARARGTEGTLRGGYAQFGKLWNAPFGRWGLPVGVALRHAQVNIRWRLQWDVSY